LPGIIKFEHLNHQRDETRKLQLRKHSSDKIR
jgi:hypothetical protein